MKCRKIRILPYVFCFVTLLNIFHLPFFHGRADALTINSGAAYSKNQAVTLSFSNPSYPNYCTQVLAQNESGSQVSIGCSSPQTWTLLPGDGNKTVTVNITYGYTYQCNPYQCNPYCCARDMWGNCASTCYSTCYQTCFNTGNYNEADSIVLDSTPPDTTITSKPSNPSSSASASLGFTSNESNSTFYCWLDSSYFGQCPSNPMVFDELSDGSHTFEVNAVDQAVNPDPTRAVYTWLVDTTPPSNGELLITAGDTNSGLSWSAFSDGAGSGLSDTGTYKIVRNTGDYPSPKCTDGLQVYLGSENSTVDTGLTNGQTYYYRICVYDKAGNVSTGATASVTPVTQVSQYTLAVTKTGTGSGNVEDLVGTPHNGTLINSPTWTTGKYDNGLSLSNGEYVEVSNTPDVFNITGDLTIAMWINPASVTCSGADPAYVLVSKRSSNIQVPYEFMIGCGGSLRYGAWGTNIQWPDAGTAAGVVTTGVWQHVAMTRSFSGINATVTFYVDGIPVGSSTQGSGPTLTNNDPLWISRGGYHTAYTNQGSYSGLMDDVQIYDRAVSSSEMTQIYSNSYSSVTNLVGNWKLDETSETTASDSAIQNLIYCGGDCNEVYNPGTVVTLTVTPDAGSIFTGWGGDADCEDGSVTMDAARTCIANFSLKPVTIVTTAMHGSIICTPNPVEHGADSTCTITPNAGYGIKDVIVDGVSVGATDTYVFTAVTDDHQISAEFFKTIDMISVGDVNGNGSEDLAIFRMDIATGANNVYVKDGLTDALISTVTLPAASDILEIRAVDDLSGNGVKEIAALSLRRSTGGIFVTLRDALTGTLIKSIFYNNTDEPIGMVVVPDLNSNGAPEIGVLSVDGTTGAAKVAIKDTLSGLLVRTILCGDAYDVISAVGIDDINNNGNPEVGVLGANKATGAVLLRLYDALTGAFVKKIRYDASFEALGADLVADLNGNGHEEGGVLGLNLSTGWTRVQVKDLKTNTLLSNIYFGDTHLPVGAVQTEDVSGNGKPEVGLLGTNETQVVVTLKDSVTEDLVRRIFYPKQYEAVRAVTVPDLNANGAPEIAVVGEDLATGAVQVTIKDASTGAFVNSFNIP